TWAAILAVLVYPAYAWLLKLLRGRATVAALTIIVLIALIIVLPGLRMVGFLSEEIVLLVRTVSSLAQGEGLEVWEKKPWVEAILRGWDMLGMHLARFDFNIDWKDTLTQGAQATSGFLVSYVPNIAQHIFLFAANFVILLFTLFFFLRYGSVFCCSIRCLTPMCHRIT